MTSTSLASAKEIGEYSSYDDAPKKAQTPVPEVFQPAEAVPPPPVATEEEEAAVPEEKVPDAYAEPISPSTVARFRHLKVYQGHLLVGGINLQVVIAGVPAREPGPGWQPAVLAVFEKRDGVFHRSEALTGLDLRPSSEVMLYPIGVDLGVERSAKLAFVTQVYGSADPKASRQTMTWRFDADASSLSVVISDFATVGTKPPKGGHRWQIRLAGPRAETIPGRNYWIRAADADVVSFFPYRSVAAKTTVGGWEFDQAGTELSPVEGFEFLLGRDAVGMTLVRAASLDDCLYGTQKPRKPLKEEAKLAWILACEAKTMQTTLRLTPGQNETAAGLRPVYVFSGAGEPLLYTALEGAKDTVDVSLPLAGDATYLLADTRFGRAIPGTGAIAPVDGQVTTVEVPAQAPGLLRLLPGPSKAAAIMTIRRLDREGGTDAGIVAAGDGDSQLRLGGGRLLIKSWPADLELEAGGYELSLSRGGEGRFCTVRALVQKQRRVVVSCSAFTKASANKRADQTFVDLAAAEGRDLPLASLRQALGVDLLAEPVERAGGRAAPLKVLRMEDEATGTVVSFVPATASLAGRWEMQKRNLTHEEPTFRFVRLVRGEGGRGLVELGCPGPGTSAFEYELLVQRIKPDAVRLFGCAGEGNPGEWLTLYDRLAASRRTPYLLTAESGLRVPSERAPRMLLHMTPKTALQTADAAIKALVDGSYEISAGGGVTLTKVTRAPKTGMVAEVDYAAMGSVPTALALYGEKGLIKETKIAPDGSAQGTLSFSLLKAETSWLRAELRGDAGVLATTTAVPLGRLLPKEGETH